MRAAPAGFFKALVERGSDDPGQTHNLRVFPLLREGAMGPRLAWHCLSGDRLATRRTRILAKRCGAKGTTLPILLDGGMVIEGSGAIIDWAETKAQDCTRSLTPQANLSEAQEIERRADEVIGVHVRSLAYAEMLPSYSHLVKPALFLR